MNEVATPRRKSLLEHFSAIKDDRQPCKVMYPLGEVLLLVVCGTMAACDDYDDIVDKACDAWNFVEQDPKRIASITTRTWATVSH